MITARPKSLLMFILAVGAALLAASCNGPTTEDGTPRRTAREVNAALDGLAAAEFAQFPERATRVGATESGLGFPFEHRLGDRSQAAFERRRLVLLDRLAQLDSTPLPPDYSALRGHLDAVHAAHLRTAAMSDFGHGRADLADARPYALDHQAGTYIEAVSLLVLDQSLTDPESAGNYVSRLQAIAPKMLDERRRLLADADAGVLPPESALHRIEQAAASLMTDAPEAHVLVTAFRAALDGIDDLSPQARARLVREAESTLRDTIYPALVELRATANGLAIEARDTPGVWALPDGDAYYDAVLAFHASRPVDAGDLSEALDAEIAAIRAVIRDTVEGLEPVPEDSFETGAATDETAQDAPPPPPLMTRLEAVLATLEAETSAEIVSAPAALEGLLPVSPEVQLEADLRDAAPDLRRWSERLVARPPETGLAISLVAPALRGTMDAATYRAPAADGSAPGVLYINPGAPYDWPGHMNYARLARTAFPGHHLQAAIGAEQSGAPLIRRVIAETAFTRGWALYAARLARERLAPGEDPASYLGVLQDELMSAGLAKTDIGLHRLRWSRDEAIAYLEDASGLAPDLAALWVDNLTVAPGRAPAAIVGRDTFLSLRARTETVLQDRFDVPAFHHAALSPGARPLAMLEADLERWYEAQL